MESASGLAVLEDEVLHNETKALWVFAYGSLCWKPGFQFNKAVTGYVQGFHRRFWQGNTTHRGTEEKPGRVATLVENSKGLVHGVAFAVSGEAAIPYLSKRECELGGYSSVFTTFYPVSGEPFKVLLYVATPKNPLWLGDAQISDIADQIVDCRGPSGYNVEYVLRLANFMKHHFPEHDDQHLFHLEEAVLRRVKERNMCLKTLMGDGEGCVTFVKVERRRSTDSSDDNPDRIETFQHTTRVPEKTLRCLNI
ncbi:glutathione-specific gamma-glutamylcyclotransferase 1 [Tribolium castaneum]|uniref:glutathione-specific gamma-glutamylcyclotransferase 1 n=1 Tax=Tribolium castaneum TaxID=7070 RepID=UPI0030FF07FE